MKQNIILIGGGGHCKSVIEVIESGNAFTIEGILDIKEKVGQSIYNYPVIGSDEDIADFIKKGIALHITIGHIKSNHARVKLFQQIKSLNGYLPFIKASTAYISKHAAIGEGSIIMHQAFINSSAAIGVNTIINTGAVIEHDVKIKDHCHISTGAFINGECTIESNCFIGSNTTLIQGIQVEKNCLIAAGSVLTKNTVASSLYAGNPAIAKKKID
jgi:sugar O-acyltransferase (sialic acid O-acetyltransferase NeuD family)